MQNCTDKGAGAKNTIQHDIPNIETLQYNILFKNKNNPCVVISKINRETTTCQTTC